MLTVCQALSQALLGHASGQTVPYGTYTLEEKVIWVKLREAALRHRAFHLLSSPAQRTDSEPDAPRQLKNLWREGRSSVGHI